MRLILVLGTATLLSIFPFFFVSLEGYRRHVPDEIYAFGHVGFFGLLTLLLMIAPQLRRIRYPVRAAAVLLFILFIGGCIELIQGQIGRSAGLRDLWQNMLGAAAAVALTAPTRLLRLVLIGVAGAALVAELFNPTLTLVDRGIARSQFPVISDFSTPLEGRRWSSGTLDTSITRTGGRSLRVTLHSGRLYTGTTLRRSFGDWSDYETAELAIYVPDEAAITVTISIRDREHFARGGAYADRFNRNVTLQQGWNDIRIPIDDIRNAPRDRTLDVSDLTELAIFASRPEQTREIHLDALRLTR